MVLLGGSNYRYPLCNCGNRRIPDLLDPPSDLGDMAEYMPKHRIAFLA